MIWAAHLRIFNPCPSGNLSRTFLWRQEFSLSLTQPCALRAKAGIRGLIKSLNGSDLILTVSSALMKHMPCKMRPVPRKGAVQSPPNKALRDCDCNWPCPARAYSTFRQRVLQMFTILPMRHVWVSGDKALIIRFQAARALSQPWKLAGLLLWKLSRVISKLWGYIPPVP